MLYRCCNELAPNGAQVAPENQGRVLQWGLVGAALLRGLCIAAGAAVLQRFRPALLLCALLLAFSSYKLLYMGDDDDEVGEGRLARLVRRVLPLSEAFDGDRFFTTGKGGRRLATPLMLVLFVIEGTDLVFAVDSIPAVFGVSNDPEIVWLSSFMAILGLRTIYTLLAEKISDSQEEISKPVAALLLFISLKIVLEFAGIAINPWVSLSVVLFLVGLGALRVARPSKKRIMGPSKVVVDE